MAKGRATDGKPPRKPGPPTASDPGRVPYHPPSPQRNPGLQYVEERHQNVEHRQTEAERQPTQGQDHLLNRPTGSAAGRGSVNPVSQKPMRPAVGNHTMIAELSHLPSLHIIFCISVNLRGISCFFACEEEGKNVG